MPVRHSEAVWEGTLREGNGTMKFGSFTGPYTHDSRFAEAPGSNPEELLGAALAGCFSMALSSNLVKAGFTPQRIHTQARTHIERVEGANTITRIELDCEAFVPGIDEQTFQQAAQATKTGCPVSRALTGTEIQLSARLVQ